MKYAETLTERPKEIKGEFFENLYENILRTNKLTIEEMKTYSESVEKYGDISLFTDYSKMEGIAIGEKRGRAKGIVEGRVEGIAEIVLRIAENGFSAEYIADLTKLSVEQVRDILKNKK
jgi:predicted transposase/invertase (TIGR01784 family)